MNIMTFLVINHTSLLLKTFNNFFYQYIVFQSVVFKFSNYEKSIKMLKSIKDNVNFSDLYKFLTSLGVVLIASAFIILWLFMKQDDGLLVSNEDYLGFIDKSKQLIDARIDNSQVITSVIPTVSIIFVFSGLFCFCIGVFHWRKRQLARNEHEDLDLIIKKMSVEQVNEVKIEEVEKDVNFITKEKNSIKIDPDTIEERYVKGTEDNSKEIINQYKTNLINIESLFVEKIREYNPMNYEPVLSNVKIADRFDLDILLKSFNHGRNPDLFIEIKFFQARLEMKIVRNALVKLLQAKSYYLTHHNRGRNVELRLVIIWKEGIADDDELKRFKKALEEYKNDQRNVPIVILYMSDKEAIDFDIQGMIG